MFAGLGKAGTNPVPRGGRRTKVYARVSRYSMKVEAFDEAQALIEEIMPQVAALPGLREFKNVGRGSDGTGVVVAIYDDQAAAEAAAEAAGEIWARFADYLTAPPESEGYDMVIDLP